MFDMYVDIEEVNRFIHSDDFIQFLLSHTTDLETAAFIIDATEKEINKIKESENNE